MDPKDFENLYRELWKYVLKHELNGEKPKELKATFGEFVLRTPKSGIPISKYLLDFPEQSLLKDARYIYKKYLECPHRTKIDFNDIVLYNALIYMGYRLSEIDNQILSISQKAKKLFDVFKLENKNLFFSESNNSSHVNSTESEDNRTKRQAEVLGSETMMTRKFLEAGDFIEDYYRIGDQFKIEAFFFREWRKAFKLRTLNIYTNPKFAASTKSFYDRLVNKLQEGLWELYEGDGNKIIKRVFSFGYSEEFFHSRRFSITEEGNIKCLIRMKFLHNVEGKAKFFYVPAHKFAYFIITEYINNKLKRLLIPAFSTEEYLKFPQTCNGHILIRDYTDSKIVIKHAMLNNNYSLSYHDYHPSITEHSYYSSQLPNHVKRSFNFKRIVVEKGAHVFDNVHYTMGILARFEQDVRNSPSL